VQVFGYKLRIIVGTDMPRSSQIVAATMCCSA